MHETNWEKISKDLCSLNYHPNSINAGTIQAGFVKRSTVNSSKLWMAGNAALYRIFSLVTELLTKSAIASALRLPNSNAMVIRLILV
jgi:hypothetical protein